jgi:four helix bundle protein
MQDYHQPEIWARAMDYSVAIYEFVADLPPEEKYNLASQLRRAATSAPLNIAEGGGAPAIQSLAGFLVSLIVL